MVMLKIPWGFKIRTCLDFKWSKRGWVENGQNFEWYMKTTNPTIWNLGKRAPFRQNPFEFQTNTSGSQMVGSIAILQAFDFKCFIRLSQLNSGILGEVFQELKLHQGSAERQEEVPIRSCYLDHNQTKTGLVFKSNQVTFTIWIPSTNSLQFRWSKILASSIQIPFGERTQRHWLSKFLFKQLASCKTKHV